MGVKQRLVVVGEVERRLVGLHVLTLRPVVTGASLGEYSSDATHGMQRLSCFEAARHGDEGVNPLGRAYVDRGATGGRSCVRSKCSMNSFLCCSVVKYRNCLLRP